MNQMNNLKNISVVIVLLLIGTVSWAQDKTSPRAEEKIVLSLEKCHEIAQEGNATIKNSLLDIEAAKHQKKEVFAEYFPTISINSMGFYAINPLLDISLRDFLGEGQAADKVINVVDKIAGHFGMNIGYQSLDYGYTALATVTQPIFAGGRIVNGNKLAKLGIEASKLQSELTCRDQKKEIDKKYWLLASLAAKEESLSAGEKLVENIHHLVQSASKAGMALESDIMTVEKERNNLKSKRLRLESGIKLAKMDLLNTIGQPYVLLRANATVSLPFIDDIICANDIDALNDPLSYFASDFDASSQSTEARLLDLSVKAAELEKKMAMGETLPEIGVGFAGGYGRLTNSNPQWNGIAFAKLSIPLTDWWKTSHKMRRLEIKKEQAQNQRDYLQIQLNLKAQMLWEEVLCTWEELKTCEKNVELDEILYSRALSKYESGQSTTSDYLQAGSTLKQSMDALTDSKITYLEALRDYTEFCSVPMN